MWIYFYIIFGYKMKLKFSNFFVLLFYSGRFQNICKNKYIFKLKISKNITIQNYSVIVLNLHILYRNILEQFFRCIILKNRSVSNSVNSRNQIFVYKIYGKCTFTEFNTERFFSINDNDNFPKQLHNVYRMCEH